MNLKSIYCYCSCKSETFSTLRFAQRAKAIKNKAVVNEVTQDDVNVLREVIRQLKVFNLMFIRDTLQLLLVFFFSFFPPFMGGFDEGKQLSSRHWLDQPYMMKEAVNQISIDISSFLVIVCLRPIGFSNCSDLIHV